MKEKLVPLQVPWGISPGATFMMLTIEETGDQKITFAGNFIDADLKLVPHTITVHFELAVWLRMSPNFDENRMLNAHEYEWEGSNPYEPFQDVEAAERLLNEKYSLWLETGTSPYPQAYQVHNSKWVASLPLIRPEYKHFMFVGQDITIEAVATGIRWEAQKEE